MKKKVWKLIEDKVQKINIEGFIQGQIGWKVQINIIFFKLQRIIWIKLKYKILNNNSIYLSITPNKHDSEEKMVNNKCLYKTSF